MTKKKNTSPPVPALEDVIERKIFLIRGEKVMLDNDLAGLYGVLNKQLKRSVNRNIDRFPQDFMFRLTREEYLSLRCHFGTFKKGAHSKYLPYAFTEQGVAMLSSVLNSKRAISVNVQIIRTFSKLRKLLASNEDLRKKIEEIEARYDYQFKVVFDAIKELLEPAEKPRQRIGFHREK